MKCKHWDRPAGRYNEQCKCYGELPEPDATDDLLTAAYMSGKADGKREASDALLGDGWRDARKELPEFGVKVIVYYQKYENKPKDFYVAQFLSDDDGVLLVFECEHCGEENFDGIFWKAIDPPSFA